MNLEIILATMNQTDDSVLEEMGICSDVIVCNQNADCTAYRNYRKDNYTVRWYDFQEKGVGLNRNNGLLRASADICLLADDDVVYTEGYEKTILDAFERFPQADMILFNIRSAQGKLRSDAKGCIRVRLHNSGKYGAVRVAFRRMSVLKNAVSFNQLFGGGCMFTAGEDTMFIRDCIRKGLCVIAVPECILTLTDKRPSTWFHGYDQKFFEDFGSSYYCHHRYLAGGIALFQLFRRRKKWLLDYSFWAAWKYARAGIKKYKNLR